MSRVDTSKSVYVEDPAAVTEFDASELRKLRYLLRRLHFLEHKVRQTGGMAGSGVPHTEWEIEALSWLLRDCGFLHPEDVPPGTTPAAPTERKA